MKWLINYIRECFCKHDWFIEECDYNIYNAFSKDDLLRSDTKVYMRCKKCGCHKTHWKF